MGVRIGRKDAKCFWFLLAVSFSFFAVPPRSLHHRLDGRLRSPRSTQVLSTRSLGPSLIPQIFLEMDSQHRPHLLILNCLIDPKGYGEVIFLDTHTIQLARGRHTNIRSSKVFSFSSSNCIKHTAAKAHRTFSQGSVVAVAPIASQRDRSQRDRSQRCALNPVGSRERSPARGDASACAGTNRHRMRTLSRKWGIRVLARPCFARSHEDGLGVACHWPQRPAWPRQSAKGDACAGAGTIRRR